MSPFVRWSFGLGATANGVNSKVLGAFVLIFYNQVLGLPAKVVAASISVALVIDAIAAPAVGLVSDNLRSRWGRRHPFMAIALCLYPIAFVLLWNPPAALHEGGLALWLGVWLIATRVLDTFYELPSLALLPEMVTGYDARTRLSAIRYFIGIAVAIGATLLAYNVFMRELPDGSGGIDQRPGWAPFSLTCASAAFLAMALCTFATARLIPRLRQPAAEPCSAAKFAKTALDTLTSRSFVLTALYGGLAAMASGLYFALNVYFLLYFWGLKQSQIGLLSTATFVAAALALVIAPKITELMGKRNASILFALGAAVTCNGPIIARVVFDAMPDNGSQALFAILWAQALLFPLFSAGHAMTLASMVADMVEEAERRTGRRSEGLLNSAETLFRKIISGGGTLASGWILSQVHFPDHAAKTGVPEPTLQHMGGLYVAWSLSFSALAVITIAFYRLDRAAHEANLRWLESAAAVAED